jgi:hypothetical protein
VQEPRVKLAWTFAGPAATSSASSKTSEKSISSCAFGTISVMALILWLRPVQYKSVHTNFIREVHGKVASENYLLTLFAASIITANTSFGLESIAT